jgi:uncharacterized Fe-S cluster-containing radical SAM superfamily protein
MLVAVNDSLNVKDAVAQHLRRAPVDELGPCLISERRTYRRFRPDRVVGGVLLKGVEHVRHRRIRRLQSGP